MITARRNGKEYYEDFLQSMLEKDSCPANQKLDDEEIMDNLLTLIIAGQTTTAAAMMWSVKFLDEHRGAQNRLRVSIHIYITKTFCYIMHFYADKMIKYPTCGISKAEFFY